MTKPLEKTFIGKGSVKDFKFTQIHSCTRAYMYKVESGRYTPHYEVFERKTAPVCVDFEKRIYSDTHDKEVYPRDNHFGVWAWTYTTYEDALEKFDQYIPEYSKL